MKGHKKFYKFFIQITSILFLLLLLQSIIDNSTVYRNGRILKDFIYLSISDNITAFTNPPSAFPNLAAIKNSMSTTILCLVFTMPKYLKNRALAVKNTWGSRCDHTFFISDKPNENFPAISVGSKPGYGNLWSKTNETLNFLNRNDFMKYFDWIVKADDDTYFIVENLRNFLKTKNSSDKYYFGKKFKVLTKSGYMSGGAGYVLSKGAFYSVIPYLQSYDGCGKIHKWSRQFEDLMIGKCLAEAGVKAAESVDSKGRERFHALSFSKEYFYEGPDWYWDYSAHHPQRGRNCCSPETISFHYVNPKQMVMLDTVLYYLKPVVSHGLSLDAPDLHNISNNRK